MHGVWIVREFFDVGVAAQAGCGLVARPPVIRPRSNSDLMPQHHHRVAHVERTTVLLYLRRPHYLNTVNAPNDDGF